MPRRRRGREPLRAARAAKREQIRAAFRWGVLVPPETSIEAAWRYVEWERSIHASDDDCYFGCDHYPTAEVTEEIRQGLEHIEQLDQQDLTRARNRARRSNS